MTKQFLIQFESDERTAWVRSDEELREALRNLGELLAVGATASGSSIPRVSVGDMGLPTKAMLSQLVTARATLK